MQVAHAQKLDVSVAVNSDCADFVAAVNSGVAVVSIHMKW